MKRFLTFGLMLMTLAIKASAQQTFELSGSSADNPANIEVFLPNRDAATGCAAILCPEGAMHWLSWDSEVKEMATDTEERPSFLATNFSPSLMPVTVPTQAPPLLIMTRADHPNVAIGFVALFMEWRKALCFC
mgnify:CR=1 FL=1